MNTERARVGWVFWLMLLLASIVGLAVSLAVGLIVDLTVGLAVGGTVLGLGGVTVWWFRRPEEAEIPTNLRSWLLSAAVLLILLMAVNFLFQKTAASPFRDLFLGNLLATIMGVVIGIPVALELTRRQQRAEEEAIVAEGERRATQRRTQYLKMMQFSLVTNATFLRSVAKNLKPGRAIYSNLDIEQLEATASLKYEIIDDLKLSAQLDVVRFNLRFIRRLLNLSLDFSYSHDRFALKPDVFLMEHKRIVDKVQEHIPRALETVTDAAAMIAKKLEHDDAEVDRAGDRASADQDAASS